MIRATQEEWRNSNNVRETITVDKTMGRSVPAEVAPVSGT